MMGHYTGQPSVISDNHRYCVNLCSLFHLNLSQLSHWFSDGGWGCTVAHITSEVTVPEGLSGLFYLIQ